MDILGTIFNFIGQKYTALATAPDKTIFWLLLAIVFIVFFFGAKMLNLDTDIAALVGFAPIVLLDLLFSSGTYTFSFPFHYSPTWHKFVVPLQIFDWIFNYGFFKTVGLATFNQVTGSFVLTQIQQVALHLYVWGDSIIELVVIFYIVYNITNHLEIAAVAAIIPTAIYTRFISNPFKEYAASEKIVEHVFYFLNHANQEQKIIVIGSLVISFLLIVFLLSTILSLLLGTASSTIRPSLQAHEYEVNYVGTAFGLSVALSVMELLHPDYLYYNFLAVALVYGLFKATVKDYANDRKQKREQREMIQNAVYDARRRG